MRLKTTRSLLRVSVGLAVVGFACDADPVEPNPPSPTPPEPTCTAPLCNRAALDAFGLHPFYQKYIDADGIPVIGSARVQDQALHVAAEIVREMLAARPDVRDTMRNRQARVGIMARTEVTTDIPEHAFLAADPVIDWDTRARGLGGVPGIPITTGAEENVLCLANDVYRGENILIHEFAHGIHLLGIDFVDSSFTGRLDSVFRLAIRDSLWSDTYAATNPIEYWAEGVQSWFDADQGPQPGIHNEINTRAELVAYDPRLAALIEEYFPERGWRPSCPAP